MDYPTEQNQYYQYYNSNQQQAAHDPSQTQPYDHSSVQVYYDYTNQQYYNSYPQQATNDPSHSQSYDQSSSVQPYYSYQYQYHQEPSSAQPSGVIHPAQIVAGPESAYYRQPHGSVESQPQISRFAGNVSAAHWTVNPQTRQSSFRGKAKRGSKPFPRGGRGNSRGQSGGRYFQSNVAMSAQQNSVIPSSALSHGQTPLPVPLKSPPRVAWCELCRVHCNTPEILEQHKNGKKHKKNWQAQERLKNQTKTDIELPKVHMPNSESKPEVVQPVGAVGSQEVKTQMGTLIPNAVAVDDGNENKTDNQKDTKEKSEVLVSTLDSVEPKGKSRDSQFQGHGRGLKRKMSGGRGGKFLRTNESSRKPVEPPKPKEVIPFICELCDVKCESQVVFNSHLAGKKHLANANRFDGQRALYGEQGLQALYQCNLSTSSSSAIPQQAPQGINDPQVLLAQLLSIVLSQAQAQTPGLVNPQLPGNVILPVQPKNPQISQTHESKVVSESGCKTGDMVEAEDQRKSTKTEFETASHGNTDVKTVDETLASEENVADCNQDEVKTVGCENQKEFVTEQVLSAAASDETKPSCSVST